AGFTGVAAPPPAPHHDTPGPVPGAARAGRHTLAASLMSKIGRASRRGCEWLARRALAPLPKRGARDLTSGAIMVPAQPPRGASRRTERVSEETTRAATRSAGFTGVPAPPPAPHHDTPGPVPGVARAGRHTLAASLMSIYTWRSKWTRDTRDPTSLLGFRVAVEAVIRNTTAQKATG